MRRRFSLLILGVVSAALTGCSHHPAKSSRDSVALRPAPAYQDAAASSLVFTPPVAFGEAPLALAREPRQPSIFIGFDEVTAEAFYIRTDDRQSDDISDRYLRRSVIEKTGVSYR